MKVNNVFAITGGEVPPSTPVKGKGEKKAVKTTRTGDPRIPPRKKIRDMNSGELAAEIERRTQTLTKLMRRLQQQIQFEKGNRG